MADLPRKSSRSDSPVQRNIEAGWQKKSTGSPQAPKVEIAARARSSKSSSSTHASSSSHNTHRQHHTKRADSENTILRRWILLILGLSGVALVTLVIWMLVIRDGASPSVNSSIDDFSAPSATHQSISSDQALAMVKTFTSATSPKDMAASMRPGNIKPEEAYQFLRDMRREHGDFIGIFWKGETYDFHGPIAELAIHQPADRVHYLPLVPSPEGEWQIDFDAFAAHCTPSFDEFPDRAIQAGIVRTYAMSYHYYNRLYADDSTWACYALRHPQSEKLLYAYCRRDSDSMQQLESAEKDHKNQLQSFNLEEAKHDPRIQMMLNRVKLTLQLSKLDNSEPRQYHIDKVISNSWVIPDSE